MYLLVVFMSCRKVPESKVHGANVGAIWGRQDPGGPHVGPMNFAIWGVVFPSNEVIWILHATTKDYQ